MSPKFRTSSKHSATHKPVCGLSSSKPRHIPFVDLTELSAMSLPDAQIVPDSNFHLSSSATYSRPQRVGYGGQLANSTQDYYPSESEYHRWGDSTQLQLQTNTRTALDTTRQTQPASQWSVPETSDAVPFASLMEISNDHYDAMNEYISVVGLPSAGYLQMDTSGYACTLPPQAHHYSPTYDAVDGTVPAFNSYDDLQLSTDITGTGCSMPREMHPSRWNKPSHGMANCHSSGFDTSNSRNCGLSCSPQQLPSPPDSDYSGDEFVSSQYYYAPTSISGTAPHEQHFTLGLSAQDGAVCSQPLSIIGQYNRSEANVLVVFGDE